MTNPFRQLRYASWTFVTSKARRSGLNYNNWKAPHNILRLVIFVLFGVVLCWLVLSNSLTAYLLANRPQTALFQRPKDAESLFALADAEINGDSTSLDQPAGREQLTPKRLKALREQVETAVMIYPLSSRGYRLLGQIAELQGFGGEVEKFMRAATRRSLRESFAVYWMMRKNFERKNYSAAAYYADVLLRSANAIDAALPYLARMAEDKNGRREVERLLAANPLWRLGFFTELGSYITDARTPLELLLSLKDTQTAPTTKELNAYQLFLVAHNLYDLAYDAWLQFLPSEKLEGVGFLFNGKFESQPSGAPFDWQWTEGVNVVSDLASRPENASDHALVIELGPGRVEFPSINQTIMLTPGTYVLKGSLMGEVIGPRGLNWKVTCVNGAAIGQSETILGSFPEWRNFEFPLVVPDSGCSVQSLQLLFAARSPSEQLVSGEIWFDDLSISRKDERTDK